LSEDIITISDLLGYSRNLEHDLLRIRRFGVTSLLETKRILLKIGVIEKI